MKYTIYRIGCNPFIVNDYEYYLWVVDVIKIEETKTGKVIYEK